MYLNIAKNIRTNESVEVYKQSAGECDLFRSNRSTFFQVATTDEDSDGTYRFKEYFGISIPHITTDRSETTRVRQRAESKQIDRL